MAATAPPSPCDVENSDAVTSTVTGFAPAPRGRELRKLPKAQLVAEGKIGAGC
jgi:hypothetical protein